MSNVAPHSSVLAFEVTGMTCVNCVRKVESAIRALPGVEVVRVSLSPERAIVEGAIPAETVLAAIRSLGYGAEPATATRIRERITRRRAARAKETAYWRRKCLWSILAIPLIVIAMASMAGVHVPHNALLQAILATITLMIIAPPFYRRGLPDLARGRFEMDSMVSLGTLIAYLASLHQVLIGGHHFHFEDAVAVLAVLTVGRYLEARSKEKAALSVEGLIDLFPHRGRVARDGWEEEIPAEAIAVGDEVVIRPGEKAPIDGLVLDGRAEADEALLTGESLPLSKASGDRVIAGSLILGGRLVVRAERTGEETTLAGILKEMERIGAKRSGYQDLADRVIRVFMPIVLATAILSFLGWWLATGEIQAALRPAIAVMIIACPCALGIAIPVAISVGAGAAARKGILIRDPAALDAIPGLGVFVFDKTGSVTTGRLRLAALRARGLDETEAFRLAAAVESGSEHPIAEAFRIALKERGLESIGRLEDFRAHPGEGVEGRIAAWRLRIGRPDWCGVAPDTDETVWLDGQAAGRVLFAAEYRREDGATAAAWFALEDAPRPEAAAMIAALKMKGLKTVLLTGDREATAARVGAILGFDAVRAGVRPAEKAAVLRELRGDGVGVAMLGDGVNDAPALAEADLGIAMGSGAAIAAEAGSIVLLKDDLSLVPEILRLGDLIRRKARQNLFWAFFYNAILIPAAAFGVMPPMAAALAMAFSDVTVIGNALLLWRFARR